MRCFINALKGAGIAMLFAALVGGVMAADGFAAFTLASTPLGQTAIWVALTAAEIGSVLGALFCLAEEKS